MVKQQPKKKKKCKGGDLAVSEVKDLLKQSYNPEIGNVGRFTVDKDLSGRRAQVYKDNTTGEVVVAHRGTASMSDWMTDAMLGVGYKSGKRFQHAKAVQDAATKKYGKVDTTVGHSLGASLAESSTKRGDEVIRVNGPTVPTELLSKQRKGVYNIRTKNDPVSILAPWRRFQPSGRNLAIKSTSFSPLTEHGVDTLDRLNPNLRIGKTQSSSPKRRKFKFAFAKLFHK